MLGLDSKITDVCVYREGARVTRSAELVATSDEVYISGLPLALDDDSVRVSIRAANPNRPCPAAAQVRVAVDVPALDDSLPPADDAELEAARNAESALFESVTQVQRELARLEKLQISPRPIPRDKGPAATPLNGRIALLEFRREKRAELGAELRKLEQDLRDATDRRAELEDRDRRRSAARNPREHELRKSVVIGLDRGHGDGDARVELEYTVPGAKWTPSYSIRVDREGGSAEVIMRALVAQGSGEDWSRVSLTLSTAACQAFVDLPELKSLRIGRRQPEPPLIGWRPPPAGTEELYRAYDAHFGHPRASEVARDPFHLQSDVEPATKIHMRTQLLAGAAPAAPSGKQRRRAMRETLREDELDDFEDTLNTTEIDLAEAQNMVAESMAMPESVPPVPLAASAAPPPAAPRSAEATRARHGALPALSPQVRAANEHLNYAELHMPGADESPRGKLLLRQRAQRYLTDLQRRGAVCDFDIERAIEQARFAARTVFVQAPPGSHSAVWSEHFDYAYPADAPATVPADGVFHSVAVCSAKGRAKVHHVIVPRESSDAFRVAEVENPLDAPLLPGTADIYLGRDFLVSTELALTPKNALVELGLGVEQAIKVARNTRYGEDSAGLLGGGRSLRHEIHIEVANHTGRAIVAEVRERIPVSWAEEDDVKVELGRVSPPWATWDPFPDEPDESKLRGGHRWHLEIARDEKKELRVHYEVRISAKQQLVGGNRREL